MAIAAKRTENFSVDELTFCHQLPELMDIECPICFQVMLYDPCLVSCCGHHFCFHCITQAKRSNKNCPYCKTDNYDTMADKGLERIIRSLQVKCTRNANGCNWEGELIRLVDHLMRYEREGECLFVVVECRYLCGHKEERSRLDQHETQACPERPYQCSYCEYKSTYSDVANEHFQSKHKEEIKSSKKVIEHKPYAFQKVELHKAENRWVRVSEQIIPESEKENQELFSLVSGQGILNKLTPQKFTDLAEKAQQLEIDTEEKLHGCIDRIFEKALKEPNYSIAYANLCRVMSTIKVSVSRPNDESVARDTSFRRELLTKCQKEFEKVEKDAMKENYLQAISEAATKEDKKRKQQEFDEWETSTRKRSLGNIRFIGELFKLKMLSEGIMYDCILRLLRSTSDHESLECFCRLITTTGKELDHPQAKVRMDRYFERISEIIEKKKISSRIKFMLQDVQDLRKCNWVPRKQEGLRTIDQIHYEAKIEAMVEQEMIKHMSDPAKTFSREDKKKGGKGTGQDDVGSHKYDKRPSAADVSKILQLRKKEGGPGQKEGQTPTLGENDRVSTSKTGPQKQPNQPGSGSGRTSLPGTRRSASQPTEKQSVLDALKGLTNPPSVAAKKPAVDKLDEDTLRRKTGTIVDEFAENKDHQEAVDCVTELESPGLMNIFVSECILHTLEKSSHQREYAGRLLEYLVSKSIVSKEKIVSGLKEVIDMADDLEVDIPKIWDFFAETLTPLFLCECLTLTDYRSLLIDAEIEFKLPKTLARLLRLCSLRGSEKQACTLWTKSGLTWEVVGLDDDKEEFLEREKLHFLNSPLSTFEDPPYLKDLVIMFGRSDTANDEILEWIEAQKIKKDSLFIRSLSRASVEASIQGEGDSCILSDKRFRNRLLVVKKWVDENEELRVEVLNAMQVSMHRLQHPPGLLSTVFWSLYDVEVVSEKACCAWKTNGKETIGRGMALQTSKRFFDWLDNADQNSDMENS